MEDDGFAYLFFFCFTPWWPWCYLTCQTFTRSIAFTHSSARCISDLSLDSFFNSHSPHHIDWETSDHLNSRVSHSWKFCFSIHLIPFNLREQLLLFDIFMPLFIASLSLSKNFLGERMRIGFSVQCILLVNAVCYRENS